MILLKSLHPILSSNLSISVETNFKQRLLINPIRNLFRVTSRQQKKGCSTFSPINFRTHRVFNRKIYPLKTIKQQISSHWMCSEIHRGKMLQSQPYERKATIAGDSLSYDCLTVSLTATQHWYWQRKWTLGVIPTRQRRVNTAWCWPRSAGKERTKTGRKDKVVSEQGASGREAGPTSTRSNPSNTT